jgi:uncharacterized membrane protein YecN with MAPEG domain
MPAFMAVIKLLRIVIRERQAARLAAWHGYEGTHLLLCKAAPSGPAPRALPAAAAPVLLISLSGARLALALHAVPAFGPFVELTDWLFQTAL